MDSNSKDGLRQRSYNFSIRIVRFLQTLPEKKVYWTISDQLMRSATSIGANIIEGKGATSRKDFINYYAIAMKSANETAYWLDLMRDGLDINSPELESLRKESEELIRMLTASVFTLKAKDKELKTKN